jgi:hypothetical protein
VEAFEGVTDFAQNARDHRCSTNICGGNGLRGRDREESRKETDEGRRGEEGRKERDREKRERGRDEREG